MGKIEKRVWLGEASILPYMDLLGDVLASGTTVTQAPSVSFRRNKDSYTHTSSASCTFTKERGNHQHLVEHRDQKR